MNVITFTKCLLHKPCDLIHKSISAFFFNFVNLFTKSWRTCQVFRTNYSIKISIISAIELNFELLPYISFLTLILVQATSFRATCPPRISLISDPTPYFDLDPISTLLLCLGGALVNFFTNFLRSVAPFIPPSPTRSNSPTLLSFSQTFFLCCDLALQKISFDFC